MKTWISIAKELPIGGKTQTTCPTNCGSGEKLSVNNSIKSYWAYCYRCGHTDTEYKGKQTLAELEHVQTLNNNIPTDIPIKLPDDFTTDIPLLGRLWLYSAGITEPLWSKYKIGYSPKLERVVLPIYKDNKLIWFQARALSKGQQPKYLQPSADRSSILFESINNDNLITSNNIVIVEDILSAIVVGRCIKTFSLLGTKITTKQAATLGKYDLITVWLDSDKAGVDGSYNIRKTLSLLTDTRNIITKLDPKKLSTKEINNKLIIN